METLNLSTYGVEEMNQRELNEVNGGIAPLIIAGLIIAGLLCCQDAK